MPYKKNYLVAESSIRFSYLVGSSSCAVSVLLAPLGADHPGGPVGGHDPLGVLEGALCRLASHTQRIVVVEDLKIIVGTIDQLTPLIVRP